MMAHNTSDIDLSASQQPGNIASTTIAYSLALIAVVLRFVSRKIAGAGFWWDDWLILPPMILTSVVYIMSTAWLLPSGFGKHIEVAGPTAIKVIPKTTFISEICYSLTITCVKYSILSFYWRLFKVSSIKLPIYVLAVITTGWGIACLCVNIFQCSPIRGYWDKTIEATCNVDNVKFWYGQSVPNILTDVAMLALPVRYIWNLQTPRLQKALLTGTFSTGGLVTAISIVRLVYLTRLDLKAPDVTWNFGDVEMWTILEMSFAVLSACLPSLRPIIVWTLARPMRGYGSRLKPSSHTVANKGSHGPWTALSLSAPDRAHQLSVNSDNGSLIAHGWDRNVNSTAHAHTTSERTEPNILLQDLEASGGIVVKQDIDVHRQP